MRAAFLSLTAQYAHERVYLLWISEGVMQSGHKHTHVHRVCVYVGVLKQIDCVEELLVLRISFFYYFHCGINNVLVNTSDCLEELMFFRTSDTIL